MNHNAKFRTLILLFIGTFAFVPIAKSNPPPPCSVIGSWTCNQQLSPNAGGVLDRNTMTVFIGEQITPPYLTTQATFNNGEKSRVITVNCPAQGTTHTETVPVRYVTDLTFSQQIPNSFGSAQTFTTTAKVIARPVSLLQWWKGENGNEEFGVNNATVNSGVSFDAAKVGNGFVLNGQTGYLQLANSTDLQLQNFTIEMWIKRSSSSQITQAGSSNAGLFGYGLDGYGLGVYSDGRLYFSWVGHDTIATPISVLSGTDFHHVAVIKSAHVVSFYVDGVLKYSASFDRHFTFTTDPTIGVISGYSHPFWGTIDEVSFYSCPLTLGQIQAIYAAGLNGNSKCVSGLTTGNGCSLIPSDCVCTTTVESTIGTVTISVIDNTEDNNNNGIPNWIEVLMGYDPAVANNLGNLNTPGYSVWVGEPKQKTNLP